MPPLSVLDLSFTTTATPGSVAIRETIDLARLTDRLGYHRFWVAEHHNLPSVASGAPEIMIGAIAAATSRIRVGAGGVMLPNHAPLMVAERFKVLEALYPDRIDLGLGRAPGTDPRTSLALRRRQEVRADDDFLERFQELMAWKTGGFGEGHPFRSIRVMPEDVPLRPIWLLGSSDYSAELAGRVGLGFAFAHHFASLGADHAMAVYHDHFTPSQWLEKPHAILTVAAICAETTEEAERLASSADYGHVRRSRGQFGPIVSPEEALAYPYTHEDEVLRRANRARLFVGTPSSLRDRLSEFAAKVDADEIMVMTAIFDQAAKYRSYELLAHAFHLGSTLPA
ncbi:MAG: LLM class flavin-dependent oxidoreductase [Geminicoccaceae bacterium]